MRENAYLQWLSASTDTIYWHDGAIDADVQGAIRNGAVGMTTNPFLVAETLTKDHAFWEERTETKEEWQKAVQQPDPDEKAEALTRLVAGHFEGVFAPFAKRKGTEAESGEKPGIDAGGYVCAQLNPYRSGDAAYCISQMKRFASWSDRLMLKIPATCAGLQAMEEAAALGFPVTSTCTLTVSQALYAGEALERGRKRAEAAGRSCGLTAVVFQPGRLDEYLRDTAQDAGQYEDDTAQDAGRDKDDMARGAGQYAGAPSGDAAGGMEPVLESDIQQAGLACVKKLYRIFEERGWHSPLLIAGFRNLRQITELAGGKLILTIPGAWADAIPEDTPKEGRIGREVEPEVVERLLQLPEFARAYREDGLSPKEFITYGAYNRTIDQLQNDGWGIMRKL